MTRARPMNFASGCRPHRFHDGPPVLPVAVLDEERERTAERNPAAESGDDDVPVDAYATRLTRVLQRVKEVAPQASCLLIGPSDRPLRNDDGTFIDRPLTTAIAETQRRIAAEHGCGFFDTFQAMGGAGTMARWYAAQPRLVSADFIHPYPAGGKQIATVFAREINAGLDRYKQRHVSTPAVR